MKKEFILSVVLILTAFLLHLSNVFAEDKNILQVVQNKNNKSKCMLYFKGEKFNCALGFNGVSSNRIAGDKTTPLGTFGLHAIYYRADKIEKIQTKFKTKQIIKIQKNHGWQSDAGENFNEFMTFSEEELQKADELKLNDIGENERLYRYDDLYDIVIPIQFNMKSAGEVDMKKGSAIFFHIARKNLTPTLGCIAVSKKDMLNIIKKIDDNTKISIKKS